MLERNSSGQLRPGLGLLCPAARPGGGSAARDPLQPPWPATQIRPQNPSSAALALLRSSARAFGAQVPSGFTCHWRSGMSQRECDCQFSVGATRGLPAHRDGIQIRFYPELRGNWAPGDGCPRLCGPSSRGHGARARHPCALMWQPPQVSSRCRPCAGTRWRQD